MKKIIFLTIFILIACNKNADLQSPSTNSSESLNGKQNNEKSLQWSEKSSHEMDWNAAINYCKNLNEDGYSDWRLPNIDELRTLIQNHSGTQTGGTCQISEKARKLAEGDRTNDCDGRNRSNFSKLGDTGGFGLPLFVLMIPMVLGGLCISTMVVCSTILRITRIMFVV